MQSFAHNGGKKREARLMYLTKKELQGRSWKERNIRMCLYMRFTLFVAL